jgi:hypothetical protein
MTLYSYHRGHHSNSSVIKIGKNCWQTCFLLFASILLMNLFSGPTISVHPYYEITHGTLYSINLKQLPHGPLQLPIHDQKKKSQKTGFLTLAFISLLSIQNAYHGPKNDVHDITYNALHPIGVSWRMPSSVWSFLGYCIALDRPRDI